MTIIDNHSIFTFQNKQHTTNRYEEIEDYADTKTNKRRKPAITSANKTVYSPRLTILCRLQHSWRIVIVTLGDISRCHQTTDPATDSRHKQLTTSNNDFSSILFYYVSNSLFYNNYIFNNYMIFNRK